MLCKKKIMSCVFFNVEVNWDLKKQLFLKKILPHNIQEEGSEKSLIILMSINLTQVFDLIKKVIIFLNKFVLIIEMRIFFKIN
jgi:hypothetical protein